jgi:hypothetical protein
VALLDQRIAILGDDETHLAAYRRLNPGGEDNDSRAALARLLFRTDAALKPVAALSGGGGLRAALAFVLAGDAPPRHLILDEPIYDLNLGSIAAIEGRPGRLGRSAIGGQPRPGFPNGDRGGAGDRAGTAEPGLSAPSPARREGAHWRFAQAALQPGAVIRIVDIA